MGVIIDNERPLDNALKFLILINTLSPDLKAFLANDRNREGLSPEVQKFLENQDPNKPGIVVEEITLNAMFGQGGQLKKMQQIIHPDKVDQLKGLPEKLKNEILSLGPQFSVYQTYFGTTIKENVAELSNFIEDLKKENKETLSAIQENNAAAPDTVQQFFDIFNRSAELRYVGALYARQQQNADQPAPAEKTEQQAQYEEMRRRERQEMQDLVDKKSNIEKNQKELQQNMERYQEYLKNKCKNVDQLKSEIKYWQKTIKELGKNDKKMQVGVARGLKAFQCLNIACLAYQETRMQSMKQDELLKEIKKIIKKLGGPEIQKNTMLDKEMNALDKEMNAILKKPNFTRDEFTNMLYQDILRIAHKTYKEKIGTKLDKQKPSRP